MPPRKNQKSLKAAAGTYKNRMQEFPHVSHYRDRHGKVRWRYRYKGMTINLGTDFGSPEFIRRYNAAIKGERLTAGEARGRTTQAPPDGLPAMVGGQHPLTDLIESWYQSEQFTRLSPSTAQVYRRIAENLRETYGDAPVEELSRATVKRLMQKKANTPEAANHMLRILRFLFDHAVDVLEWVEANPAREVKKYKPVNTGGFHTWTDIEINQYFKAHKEGSVADLAMALMLYTGAARSDAVRLGPENVKAGRLQYNREKMKSRNGVLVDIPIHPELSRRLSRLTSVQETFLETRAGHQRSANGLGNAMRKWCDQARLPDCTAHGLRKACARRLAEAGATPHEIMAVTGHKTLSEVERYTEKVARAGLADSALGRVK